MIMRREILKGKECPADLEDNLLELLVKINKVRDAWGRPMTVTSGFRSIEEHLAIYKKKGITDQSKIPMKSKHLTCQAVDIYDKDSSLYSWCKTHELLLSEIGVWLEERQGAWVHFQTIPFASYKPGGTIFFKP